MTAEQLLQTHRRLVDLIVADVAKGNPRDLDDMTQDGLIALWQCTQRWDPTRGPFASFARSRIRGAVIDGLRDRTGHRRHGADTVHLVALDGLEVGSAAPGPEQTVMDRDRLNRALGWVAAQPARTRDALAGGNLSRLAVVYGVTPSMMSRVRTTARARVREIAA